MPKTFNCNKCKGAHQRPINSKCQQVVDSDNSDTSDNETQDTNKLILQELKSLSGRMAAVEEKVNKHELTSIKNSPVSSASSQQPEDDDSNDDVDLILPSIQSLKQSRSMQQQVDARIQQLQQLNEQGKFKSKRGGGETIWVKREVPWPQHFVLGGTNKNRLTYDALSMSQWVSGFAQIIREETNQTTRNNMLDYLADLMEDSHDFGWSSAKGSHAVLLCKMEDNKIDWSETHKIDRVRRVHAQRSSQNHQVKSRASKHPITCKYFQKGSCHQKADHEVNCQMYLHVCQNCYQQGKSYPHPAKDCRTRSKNE